ncbi:MAG: glycerophosphodiester phosphodiesterase [Trueperaceae bacterium]
MRFLRVILVLIVILAAAYGVLALIAKPAAEHAYFDQFDEDRLVLAHGGGQRLWPDNTMRAFLGAADIGADVLEVDVHQDADGVFRVIHDSTVDRTTDGVGAVADLTGVEIAALDAGYRWTVSGPSSAATGEFPYRGQGATIPTLAEVLSGTRDMAVNIELKQDSEAAGRALCEQLREGGDALRVMVASFHTAPMRAFRQACPEVATSATRAEVTLFYVLARARLAAVYSPPFQAVQVPVAQGGLTVVTPHFIQAAQARNLRVQVWTINERAEMDRLLALGVDGLITDRPDRALAAMGRSFDTALVPDFVAP